MSQAMSRKKCLIEVLNSNYRTVALSGVAIATVCLNAASLANASSVSAIEEALISGELSPKSEAKAGYSIGCADEKVKIFVRKILSGRCLSILKLEEKNGAYSSMVLCSNGNKENQYELTGGSLQTYRNSYLNDWGVLLSPKQSSCESRRVKNEYFSYQYKVQSKNGGEECTLRLKNGNGVQDFLQVSRDELVTVSRKIGTAQMGCFRNGSVSNFVSAN